MVIFSAAPQADLSYWMFYRLCLRNGGVSAKDFIRAWVEHEHNVDTVLLGQIQQLRQS